jgi:hypothetical protein
MYARRKLHKNSRDGIIFSALAHNAPEGHTMKSDLELTTAQRDLLALDHAIGKLYDKFGDRVDSRADFIEAEERRFTALECLATARAQSPEGMVAKARVLKAVDDTDRQAAIGASLADDVLRYFSRAA